MSNFETYAALVKEIDIPKEDRLAFIKELLKKDEEKAAKAKAEEKEEEKARKAEERARRLEERNWKIEDDERKIAAKREEDDRKHKHEIELRRINSNMAATEQAGEHSTRLQLKFRDLREGEEILNYLTQFECIATTNNYSRSMWASTLLSRLTGECLNIIGTLTDIQKMDYDHIKKKLLTCYGKSEDEYRKAFVAMKLESHLDTTATIFKMKENLLKYFELAEIDTTDPKALLDQFLILKIYDEAGEGLFSFLKERKIKTEDQLRIAVATFRDSHPHEQLSAEETVLAQTVAGRYKQLPRTQSPTRNRRNSLPNIGKSRPIRITCYHCGKEGHMRAECWRLNNMNDRQRQGPNSSGRYKSWGYQHNRNSGDYTNRREYSPPSPSRYYSGTNRNPQDYRNNSFNQGSRLSFNNIERQKNNNGDTEAKQIVATARDANGRLFYFPAVLNGKNTLCLRDTGCTTLIVDKAMVKESDYTGEVQEVRLANRMSIHCDMAKIEIDCPWVTGSFTAVVMENPICPLIVGNIPGIPDDSMKFLEAWQAKKGKMVVNAIIQDDNAEKLKPIVQTHLTAPEMAMLQKEDEVTKKLMNNINKRQGKYRGHCYEIKNDILVRIFQNNSIKRTQIVIPETLKGVVLETAHDSPLAGHMGVRKTINRILDNSFWPGIHQDVKRYIGKCKQCITKNHLHSKHIAPIQPTDKIGRVFEKVAIDIVGPLPIASKKGHRFILTLIDMASRWPEAIPLRDIKSETICSALLDIFSRYGFPDTLLSDNGKQFTSNVTNALTKLLQITQVHSTIYRPQANGMCERWNKTLKVMLAKATEDHPKEWNEYIPAILFAYRGTVHDATGYSPFELMFGSNPRGPLSLLNDRLLGTQITEQDTFQFITEKKSKMVYGLQSAQQNAEGEASRQRKLKNKNRYLRQLKETDNVYVWLPTWKGVKLWQGPFVVKKKVNEVDYAVDIKGTIKIVHVDLLRKYDNMPDQITQLMEDINTHDTDINEEVGRDEELSKRQIEEQSSVVIIEEQPTLANIIQTEEEIQQITPLKYRKELQQLLNEFKDVITEDTGYTRTITHVIELNKDANFKKKQYAVPYAYREAVKKELNHLIETNKIQRSNSSVASPMVIVKKKNGKVRICCDYRDLNKITKIDAEPLRDTNELLEEIGNSTIFTHLDLNRGFWQIGMDEESKQYTAFTTDEGLFEWNVMPFGLVNSTATFSRFMRIMLADIKNVVHFVDDICIHSKDIKTHMQSVREVLTKLREHGATIAPEKLKFANEEMDFLGFKVGKNQIRPTDGNKNKILNLEIPKTKKEVKGVLGLFNFYSKFIPKYSDITLPLRQLITKDSSRTINWSKECQDALQLIKQYFEHEVTLTAPNFEKTLTLVTDASNYGLGACLMQEVDKVLRPIFYLSRSLNKTEQNYSTVEKECLAIVWSMTKLQKYLLGRKFILLTDHKPLLAMNNKRIANSKINRWLLILLDFQYEIKSIKGKDNVVADFLSRQNVDSTETEPNLNHISQHL
ncbi:uncharacterized protein LOC131934712 [Physella acuta]|uniref:uncharacterized protein LOC131934712 n=1 Tax=Physella acuta TaxID=109671 RepID=UPI0027DD9226|nr:uncharacterized protein LOC131934712 [Physella acuta]